LALWVFAREGVFRVISRHFPHFAKAPELFDALYAAMDTNGDGMINFREFVVGLSATVYGTIESKMTFLFHAFGGCLPGVGV
jgi:hypothetical protein